MSDLKQIAAKMGLNQKFVELLFSRGICSEDEISRFLSADESSLNNPFGLLDMEQATQRVKRAIDDAESVVIFGDYDADGVCSAAILYDFLKNRGVDVAVYIPHRINDGYGLSMDAVERIAEQYMPALLITCDCGISCAAEVEHLLDLGIDVIVTDHHEVPQILPSCPCVNPKRTNQEYAFAELCGAGVAFKLVEAVAGRAEALKYLPLAALATVADIVPLRHENRVIVQLGLQELNKRCNLGIKMLCEFLGIDEIDSSAIAYKIAPRLNAAGRMGDATRAFELLVSNDSERIGELINEIELANTQRKTITDQIYQSILASFPEIFNDKKCVCIKGKGFNKGVLGIVAARLCNDLGKPVFLTTEDNGVLHGTARGIDGFDVFGALCSVSQLLGRFGGHCQAAGYSMQAQNWKDFVHFIEEYSLGVSDAVFSPHTEYDIELNEQDISMEFAQALRLLEPFGRDNSKPIFKMIAHSVRATPLKNYPQHLNIALKSKEIIGFNQSKALKILTSPAKKELFVEVELNTYKGQESVRTLLKSIYCENLLDIDQSSLELDRLRQYLLGAVEASYTQLERNEAMECAKKVSTFGTLLIALRRQTYSQIVGSTDIACGYGQEGAMCNISRIYLGYEPPFNLSAYSKIYILDNPPNSAFIAQLGEKSGAKIFSLLPTTGIKLRLPREHMGRLYNIIRSNLRYAGSINDYCVSLSSDGVEATELMAALVIFCELGLIRVSQGANSLEIKVMSGVKSDLERSALYREINEA